jgi:hydroxymethylbilane synthase
MSERVVVGTRGSKLALAQAEKVIRDLKKAGYTVEIQVIKTSGDIMKDKPLYTFKSGAFVRTIDEALADGEIDVAVHSLKDVPVDRVEGTVISAVLERESPHDAFISRNGERIEDLDSGSVIGTSSLRRMAQIRRYRPDFKIKNLRGNLDTRIRKLRDGEYDGIIVAEAGLLRLGIDVIYQRIEHFIPSANQGIIAVATREGEEDLVSFMNHRKTYLVAMAEREVLTQIGLGCSVPAGILAEAENGEMRLKCEILNTSGEEILAMQKAFEFNFEEGFGKCTASVLKNVIEEAAEFGRDIKEKLGDEIKSIEGRYHGE